MAIDVWHLPGRTPQVGGTEPCGATGPGCGQHCNFCTTSTPPARPKFTGFWQVSRRDISAGVFNLRLPHLRLNKRDEKEEKHVVWALPKVTKRAPRSVSGIPLLFSTHFTERNHHLPLREGASWPAPFIHTLPPIIFSPQEFPIRSSSVL